MKYEVTRYVVEVGSAWYAVRIVGDEADGKNVYNYLQDALTAACTKNAEERTLGYQERM